MTVCRKQPCANIPAHFIPACSRTASAACFPARRPSKKCYAWRARAKMASFQYLAIDSKGKLQKGVLEADTSKQARQALRGKNLIPTEVQPFDNRKTAFEYSSSFSFHSFKEFFKRRSLSNKDLTLVTRQLATLFNAGLPIAEVLNAVSERTTNPQAKRI